MFSFAALVIASFTLVSVECLSLDNRHPDPWSDESLLENEPQQGTLFPIVKPWWNLVTICKFLENLTSVDLLSRNGITDVNNSSSQGMRFSESALPGWFISWRYLDKQKSNLRTRIWTKLCTDNFLRFWNRLANCFLKYIQIYNADFKTKGIQNV